MLQKTTFIIPLGIFILFEILLILGQAYPLAFAFFLLALVIGLTVYKYAKKFNTMKTILSKEDDVETILPISDDRILVVFRNKEGIYFVQPIDSKKLKTIDDLIVKKVIDYEITQGDMITKLTKTFLTKDLKTISETQYNWTFILENKHKITIPLPLSYKDHVQLENFMLKYFKK